MSPHPHRPEIVRIDGYTGEPVRHYVVCADCGLLLWFVPLEDLGVRTCDWTAPEYAIGKNDKDAPTPKDEGTC